VVHRADGAAAETPVRCAEKIAPSPTGTKEDICRRFSETQAFVRAKLLEWADLDLNGIRFANPLAPIFRYQLGPAFLLMAAHNRRHVWQARRVLEAKDFPHSR